MLPVGRSRRPALSYPDHPGVSSAFDEVFLQEIQAFHFTPATLDGTPVTDDLYIEVNYDVF